MYRDCVIKDYMAFAMSGAVAPHEYFDVGSYRLQCRVRFNPPFWYGS